MWKFLRQVTQEPFDHWFRTNKQPTNDLLIKLCIHWVDRDTPPGPEDKLEDLYLIISAASLNQHMEVEGPRITGVNHDCPGAVTQMPCAPPWMRSFVSYYDLSPKLISPEGNTQAHNRRALDPAKSEISVHKDAVLGTAGSLKLPNLW